MKNHNIEIYQNLQIFGRKKQRSDDSIKTLHSDNGEEYNCQQFEKFLKFSIKERLNKMACEKEKIKQLWSLPEIC